MRRTVHKYARFMDPQICLCVHKSIWSICGQSVHKSKSIKFLRTGIRGVASPCRHLFGCPGPPVRRQCNFRLKHTLERYSAKRTQRHLAASPPDASSKQQHKLLHTLMLSRPVVLVSSNPTRFYSDDLLKFHQPRRLSPATVAQSWRNCAVAMALYWPQRVLNYILQAKLQTLAHVVSRRPRIHHTSSTVLPATPATLSWIFGKTLGPLQQP